VPTKEDSGQRQLTRDWHSKALAGISLHFSPPDLTARSQKWDHWTEGLLQTNIVYAEVGSIDDPASRATEQRGRISI